MKEKFNCVINTENQYLLQVGEILVEMQYSDNNKTFNESMLNILKQKNRMG